MDDNTIWLKFLEIVNNRVSRISYNTWFKDIKLFSITTNDINIVVPYPAHKSHLTTNYMDMMEEIFLELTGINYSINIFIQSEIKEKNETPLFLEIDENVDNSKNNIEYKKLSNFNSKYTFENFVVGDSNRFAYSSALAVAENPGKLYNPLFLYGKSGLGKTHLMHAIGNYITTHTNKKVLYTGSDKFMDEFISINRDTGNKDDNINYIEMFKKKYRDVDVLMIDDIQFLGSAPMSQQELTNTFNSLYYDEKQIVICSDRSVDDLKMFEERLKTRFNWGLKAVISVPDIDLKMQIIKKKINDGDLAIRLSDEIINFVASNCGSDVRNLEGAVRRLHAYAAIMNISTLTMSDALEALKDYTNNLIYTPNTISKIQNVVSKYFNLTVDDLKGKRRSKDIANARMISMYLCRIMTDETYPHIGLEFGGRDHSTVIHAYEKINSEVNSNVELNNIVSELKKQICE